MDILIPEYKIERRVRAMAHTISEEHKNSGNPFPPVMVCVLNGAFMFFSDLVKDMGIDIEVDFIRAKSYNGQDNSGGVKITKHLEVDLNGKRVYIVDDIVDTGATMTKVMCMVNDKAPAEVRVITLVDRASTDFPIDHTCFPNMGLDFFVGYGFDDNGLKRNYRNIYDIGVVNKE